MKHLKGDIQLFNEEGTLNHFLIITIHGVPYKTQIDGLPLAMELAADHGLAAQEVKKNILEEIKDLN